MVNFNPIDRDYIVSWQSDLENTKESIFPVCDKPYHKITENMLLVEECENLELSIAWKFTCSVIYLQIINYKSQMFWLTKLVSPYNFKSFVEINYLKTKKIYKSLWIFCLLFEFCESYDHTFWVKDVRLELKKSLH